MSQNVVSNTGAAWIQMKPPPGKVMGSSAYDSPIVKMLEAIYVLNCNKDK